MGTPTTTSRCRATRPSARKLSSPEPRSKTDPSHNGSVFALVTPSDTTQSGDIGERRASVSEQFAHSTSSSHLISRSTAPSRSADWDGYSTSLMDVLHGFGNAHGNVFRLVGGWLRLKLILLWFGNGNGGASSHLRMQLVSCIALRV